MPSPPPTHPPTPRPRRPAAPGNHQVTLESLRCSKRLAERGTAGKAQEVAAKLLAALRQEPQVEVNTHPRVYIC